jgi:hypothetical protein
VTVHHEQNMKGEDQQDATIRCLLLTSVSTCFGHHYDHLQENKGRVTAYGDIYPPAPSFQGTAQQLDEVTPLDFSSVERECIQLLFRRNIQQRNFDVCSTAGCQPGTFEGA